MTTTATPTLRLLAIDDSRADAMLLRAVLNRAEFGEVEFVHATDGDSALTALAAEAFDCVFLDYVLEHEDGGALLRRLREAHPDVPVIGLSGCGTEHAPIELLKLGAQDYLTKVELTPAGVRRAVSDAIERVTLRCQLESQREELRNFAGVAAHDLAAPLRHIGMFAELIREDLEAEDSGEACQHLERITATVQRMHAMLKSLLHYANAGRSSAALSDVELADVVATAIENLASDIAAAAAVVVVDGLPCVHGCADSLVQLFQNLVGNSIKFRGEEPVEVRVGAQRTDEGWRVSVRDNGIGFDPEFAQAIFEPFRRLHSGDYDGAGIGLATCQRIVAQHGGRLWAESVPGAGATFHVTFAAAPPESARG